MESASIASVAFGTRQVMGRLTRTIRWLATDIEHVNFGERGPPLTDT